MKRHAIAAFAAAMMFTASAQAMQVSVVAPFMSQNVGGPQYLKPYESSFTPGLGAEIGTTSRYLNGALGGYAYRNTYGITEDDFYGEARLGAPVWGPVRVDIAGRVQYRHGTQIHQWEVIPAFDVGIGRRVTLEATWTPARDYSQEPSTFEFFVKVGVLP